MTDPVEARRQLLERLRTRGTPPAVLPAVGFSAVPSRHQRRFLWFDLRHPGTPVNNLAVCFQIDGPLDVERLTAAFARAVGSFDVLGTRVDPDDGLSLRRSTAPVALELHGVPDGEDPLEALAAAPFHPGAALVRGHLLRSRATTRILLVAHHAVMDGGSLPWVLRAIAAAYCGEEVSAAPSHATAAAWLASSGPVSPRRLASAPTLLFPLRPTRHDGDELWFRVPAGPVRALATARQGTPFCVLVAAFGVAVAKFVGQRSFRIGTPASLRTRSAALEPVVGPLLNTVVLEITLDPAAPFAALVDAVARELREASADVDTPIDEQLGDDGAAGLQLLVSYRDVEDVVLDLPGLETRPVPVRRRWAELPLTLEIEATHDGFGCALRYRSDSVDAATAGRIAREIQWVLAAAVDHPAGPVAALLEVCPEHLRELLPFESSPPLPPVADPVARLREAAARHPDRIALQMGETRVSYRAFHARTDALAAVLRARGATGSVVAVSLPRSVDLVVALWAILEAGGTWLPLDPAAPPARTALVLADASPALVLGVDPVLPVVDRPPGPPAPDVPAYVIYTSGSTGRPKGVVIGRDNLAQFLAAMDDQLGGEPGVWFAVTSVSFDIAVLELLWPLTRGFLVVIAPELDPSHRPPGSDPRTLGEIARDARPTHLQCTPSLARILGRDPAFRAAAAGLSTWILGGERCTGDLVREIRSYCGARLINAYGPTETTIWSTMHPIDAETDPVPIGRPLPRTTCRVLDLDGRRVPPGVPGELWIGGSGVARGYLGRPDLDRERFHDDPTGGRLYHTGDRVRWREDGRLEYLGRRDDQVKVRGLRVELGEIEAALAGVAGIRQIAVVAREVRGETALHAHYTGDGAIGVPELTAAARERLPGEMIPSRWFLVEAMPLLPSGKVDRAELVPDALPEAEGGGPLTDTERWIGEVFARVLGRPCGREQSFFDLGGHSLLAVEVAGILRERASAVPLDLVFRAPTVASLALRLDELSEPGRPVGAANGESARVPSYGQLQLWLLERIAPGAYNHEVLLALDGRVDPDAIRDAFARIVARHEVLRTAFVDRDGVPELVVYPVVDVPWTVVALGPVDDRELVARSLPEVVRPFDLARAPLLRVTWFSLEPRRHALLLVVHHLVWDAASAAALAAELTDELGPAPQVRPLPLQYGDFAARQRARFDGPGADDALRFFRRTLPPTEPLALCTDRPRGAGSTAGGAAAVRVPAEVVEQLRSVARSAGTTLFVACLAAFQIWLARQAGQRDVRVGVPVANRSAPETRRLIGYLVNTVVVRADLAGAPTGREVVRTLGAQWLEVLRHSELPFPRLVEALAPERNAGRSPLVHAMFVFQEDAHPLPAIPGLAIRRIAVPPQSARFDVSLVLEPGDDGFDGFLTFPTALFDDATAARWSSQLEVVFRSLARRPDSPFDQLPTRSDPGPDAVPPPDDRPAETVHERVARFARLAPDTIAVEDPSGSVSYGELVRRGRQMGAALAARGAGPDRPVLVVADAGIALAVAFLGAWFAGAAVCGLPPGAPPDHRRRIEAELQPAVVIEAEVLSGPASIAIGTAGDPICYVAFTSGSTGRPKGIEQLHHSFVQFLDWQADAFRIGPGQRIAVWSPIHYDACYCELFGALCHGATACFAPPERALPERMARWVEAAGIHWFQTVPSFATAWLDAADELGLAFPELQSVAVSGEVLPVSLARRWWDRFADRVALVNLYGPSETVLATAHRVDRPAADAVRIPIGRPIAGRTILLVDPNDRLVPDGAAGEILIRTRYATRGYLRRPEETGRVFVPNPLTLCADDPVFRTGDRARLRPDGALEFLGRRDRMVKLRGHRVDLAEIEAVALEHPSVRAAAADVRDETRLVLWVEADRPLAPQAVRRFLGDRLPPERVPGRVVPVTAMPRTATGKVDPQRLPLPPPEAPGAMPDGRLESVIARVWCQVLGRASVGRHDNFFDVGGESLLLARVADRLQTELSTTIPLVDLFQFPTVADLASRLATNAPLLVASGDPAGRRAATSRVRDRRRSRSEAES